MSMKKTTVLGFLAFALLGTQAQAITLTELITDAEKFGKVSAGMFTQQGVMLKGELLEKGDVGTNNCLIMIEKVGDRFAIMDYDAATVAGATTASLSDFQNNMSRDQKSLDIRQRLDGDSTIRTVAKISGDRFLTIQQKWHDSAYFFGIPAAQKSYTCVVDLKNQ